MNVGVTYFQVCKFYGLLKPSAEFICAVSVTVSRWSSGHIIMQEHAK